MLSCLGLEEAMLNRAVSLIVFALVVVLASCSQTPPPAPDTREADTEAIRDMEAASLKDWAAKDVDKIATFYADDASLLMPNMAIVSGKDAIKNALQQFVSDPNFSLSFASTKVEASRASDYAYSQGTYTQTMTDPKTKKTLTENGKFVTVFKKQPDGSWKAVADIINGDAPAAPAK